ncbi:AzlD domain-containing protein [Pseudoalteromonas sp. MMG010]|uniref:AzlD domain-containing protein n=1 Tax=Pseudoalteromonas sp. MMG010 TaxID=2822685 RepID=UPI001B3A1F37|nr:AzlD domain-containing protein [Pseudoalteromonas sp. MMG010]MBQ4834461.1 AzlD domain-containing protein [Pseudoalteromonas sp. MMG010]
MMTTILLMACITFFTRYLFLHKALPFKVGPKMQQFLSFSAPAVLTAIWVPIVFINEEGVNLNLSNPYLSAAVLAIIVAYKTHNIYYTTLFGMGLFLLLN